MWEIIGLIGTGIVLALLCYIDLRSREVPIIVTAVPVLFGLIAGKLNDSNVKAGVICLVVVFAVFKLVSVATSNAFGSGDAYVLASPAVILGPLLELEMVGISFIISSVISAGVFILKKTGRNHSIPFVPCVFSAFLGVVICHYLL